MERTPHNTWGTDEFVRILSEIEPILRAHVRRRRGQRDPMLATSDICASVARRAVEYVARPAEVPVETALPPSPEVARTGAINFVLTLADRTISGALRKLKREHSTMRGASARGFVVRSEHGGRAVPTESAEMQREGLLAALEESDETDRLIAQLRTRGNPWPVIVSEAGISADNCRQRWSRLLKRLSSRLEQDEAQR